MSLDPLLSASWHIQVHAISAIGAFFLGVIQFSAPKGTLPHRTLGVIWVALMSLVTITSVFIQHPVAPGDPFWARFSPIHILTVLTAVGLVNGVRRILKGGRDFKIHAQNFKWMFIGGLIIAGLLAFTPGRIMHQVVFG